MRQINVGAFAKLGTVHVESYARLLRILVPSYFRPMTRLRTLLSEYCDDDLVKTCSA